MAKQQGRAQRFIQRVFTDEPLPGCSLIEVVDDRRVLIENHKGIVAYGCNEICVKVHNGTVKIEGSHLELMCMSKERIVIIGQIEGVRVCKGVK